MFIGFFGCPLGPGVLPAELALLAAGRQPERHASELDVFSYEAWRDELQGRDAAEWDFEGLAMQPPEQILSA